VLKTIGNFGHNVTHARINTEKGVAVDAIYIRDAHGQKITLPKDLETLAKAIAKAIQGDVATAIR
jgi:[protein-PII] uridylyltransferase